MAGEMSFVFEVQASVSRESGPFAGREEIETEMIEWLEAADGGSIQTDNDGIYNVEDWSVDTIETSKRKPKAEASLNVDALLLAADKLMAAYFERFPISIGGSPQGAVYTELDRIVSDYLIGMPGIGPAITKAKQRAYERGQRANRG